jgi:hypothetical protein
MGRTVKPRPTQERIKELFHYDPETGVFVRRDQPRTWTGDGRKHGKVGGGRISTLGYVMVSVDAVNYNAGLLAWLYVKGTWPVGRIKYLNGCKTDNRISNLFVQDKSMEEIKSRPLTQERLKELLHYEPSTGWFTWRVCSSIANIGDRAGGHHGFGYRQMGLDYKKFLEHQLAFFYMTGEWPDDEVDHINGNKADNRWSNLRSVTKSQNGHNKPVHRRSKTGYPGVYLHAGMYRARIHVEGETIDLSGHRTIAEARVARLLSEIEHFDRCTTFVEERDSNLPGLNGLHTVKIELSSTDLSGGDGLDCIAAYTCDGVPFWVRDPSAITRIINVWLDKQVEQDPSMERLRYSDSRFIWPKSEDAA